MDIAFVTGGTGFVGANVVRTLLEKRLLVRCLVRKKSNRKNLDGLAVDFIQGDLSDAGSLARGCRNARYVFHVAADYRIWTQNPQEMIDTNVQGTVNVLDAASKSGAERIVHCSSVATVKPGAGGEPADEASVYSTPSELVGAYKKTKWISEQSVLDRVRWGMPIVIVNPAAPIGPYDIKPTPTGRIVVDFLNGRMPSYIDTGLNIVHVRDVAEGHYQAALRGRVGERYILGGENLTLKQTLDALADIAGLPAPRFKTPYAVAYGFAALDTLRCRLFGGEPIAPLDAVRMAAHYMYFDSSKAKRELQFKQSSSRSALRDAVEWFVSNGYVKNDQKAAHILTRLRKSPVDTAAPVAVGS